MGYYMYISLLKEKGNLSIYENMDEPRGQYAK